MPHIPFSHFLPTFKAVTALKIYNTYKNTYLYLLPLLLFIFSPELREYCDVTSDCREFAYVCYKNRCECSEGK